MAAVWQDICHIAAIRVSPTPLMVPAPEAEVDTQQIWKVRVRDALAPRREPYWGPPPGEGKSLGLRKVDATRSRWIAKLRNETGHHSKVLGDVTLDFDYEGAREAALAWFKSYASGITDSTYTVEQACRDYGRHASGSTGSGCFSGADSNSYGYRASAFYG